MKRQKKKKGSLNRARQTIRRAPFSRDDIEPGDRQLEKGRPGYRQLETGRPGDRQLKTGRIAGLAKRGGPRLTNPLSRVCGPRRAVGTKKKKGATDNVLATRGLLAMCEPRTRNNLERLYFLPVVEGTKGTWEMHGGFSAGYGNFGKAL